jgi:hypothetical protein
VPSRNVTSEHVLSGTVAIVGIPNCVLAGLIAALVANLFVDRSAVYISMGVAAGLASAVMLIGIIPRRLIARMRQECRPRVPASSDIPDGHRGG